MSRYIIVIAESMLQFKNYVNSALKNEITIECKLNQVKIKETIFLWIRDYRSLFGYQFSEDSKLVKVGSWYNLPEKELIAIEMAFKVRMVK